MEVEYLREFTVVANLQSFSRAAEELCISQSSLSKHILALERELGVPLLTRSSRSVTLSSAGAQILPMAAQIYELSNKIRVTAAKQSSRERALLTIASIPVMAQYRITGALAKFQREYPNVTLEIRECEHREIWGLLERGECELAFSRREMESDDLLETLDFCRDYLVAVVARDHPLAQQESIALPDLRGEKLLLLDRHTGFYELCSRLCRKAGFEPDISYAGCRPENIVDLAAGGMGAALLMKRHTDYLANPDVRCLDISPRIESTVCLVRRRGQALTAPANAFWTFIRENRPEQIHSEAE